MTPRPLPLANVSRELAARCDALRFPSVAHVYNPLAYARIPHERYLERFGTGPKEVLLLGMNPGPFGMAQTGVPFGDVAMVRDFLGIEGEVTSPPNTHPKRPIDGFGCKRSEVSGTRLWGFAKERFGTAAAFGERFFVWNYCPLVFMEASAANKTPDKLPAVEREPLFLACDDALRAVVDATKPKYVLGVGAWAKGRAEVALAGRGLILGSILHPSPASPRANRGWAEQAAKELEAIGIRLP